MIANVVAFWIKKRDSERLTIPLNFILGAGNFFNFGEIDPIKVHQSMVYPTESSVIGISKSFFKSLLKNHLAIVF